MEEKGGNRRKEFGDEVSSMAVDKSPQCSAVFAQRKSEFFMIQRWALSVFLNFFNNKNDFLRFLSSLFDWEWAF